ncbi:preprotein translocase subunit SecY [Kangiella spongicola]|jgi:preprotein translocase subunit SecY|uniref:Protein translocase subunit SecY n=1 Tax=Kangiella spongicola TaxID=796379 RepID=A0A318D6V0_9GAMM|nr:preprotein translocase subunit SecY [Kangiella spongicola]MBV34031.1 preprotein translocase subunit SecY [Rickettsiales bacterium]PXF63488.1 preprotein translocase subunit SecY [Kangiella spongicola]
MALSPQQLAKSGGLSELKQRLLFVLIAIVVFRLGSFIPVPGVNADALKQILNSDTIFSLFNVFSGGAMERASVLALGIMPYISASIIMQILSYVDPRLKEIKKEGESGRRKINQYTRYLTVALATVQAFGMATQLPNMVPGLVENPDFSFYFVAIATLVTGTMFLMWLGEQITERGIGNGISIIILVGIVAGFPQAIQQVFSQAYDGQRDVLGILVFGVFALAVIYFIVWFETAQRRITINYAKRQQGNKVFAAQSSFLPMKLNMAGVIPAIFASSIVLFPGTLLSWFGNAGEVNWLTTLSQNLQPGNPVYMLLYAAGIIFFAFFYTALTQNPRDTADNLKKSGAFIPGIRPGQQTASYLDKVTTRLTFWGALYMTAVCLLPEFLILLFEYPFYFGGTSLLIIVVVAMDFMAQVQAHLMSQQYDSVLKKANLKKHGPSGRVRR